jgi:Lrp/AsnC family leucine-responsive transcriptional regulator
MPDYELDRADCRILEIVQRDGRISNVDLAGHVALSPSPCLRRLSRLEESGVIAQYVALVDPTKVGLGLIGYCEVMLNKKAPEARAQFKEAVLAWPEVLTCYALTGHWDYLLKVITQDLDHYSRFVMEKLLALPEVANVQSSFVLEKVKETTALNLNHLPAMRTESR